MGQRRAAFALTSGSGGICRAAVVRPGGRAPPWSPAWCASQAVPTQSCPAKGKTWCGVPGLASAQCAPHRVVSCAHWCDGVFPSAARIFSPAERSISAKRGKFAAWRASNRPPVWGRGRERVRTAADFGAIPDQGDPGAPAVPLGDGQDLQRSPGSWTRSTGAICRRRTVRWCSASARRARSGLLGAPSRYRRVCPAASVMERPCCSQRRSRQCYRRHRTKGFLDFRKEIGRRVTGDLEIHIVMDNCATHK